MPLYSLKDQTLTIRWEHFHSSSSAIFVDDAVPQWVLYCVCVWTQEKRWNDGAGEFLNTRPTARSGTFGLSSLPQHEKNIFMPSDSNHMMMSSLRCKHGCVVRIPPSIDRVLRNGFPA